MTGTIARLLVMPFGFVCSDEPQNPLYRLFLRRRAARAAAVRDSRRLVPFENRKEFLGALV
jgi:hypothetical protein